jgi:hypothetical protein
MLMPYAQTGFIPDDGNRPACRCRRDLALEGCQWHRALLRPASARRGAHRHTPVTKWRARSFYGPQSEPELLAAGRAGDAVLALRDRNTDQRSSLQCREFGGCRRRPGAAIARGSPDTGDAQRSRLSAVACDVDRLLTDRSLPRQLHISGPRARWLRQARMHRDARYIPRSSALGTGAGATRRRSPTSPTLTVGRCAAPGATP